MIDLFRMKGFSKHASSGRKDCFIWLYFKKSAIGRMFEPVYIKMKKNTPVMKIRGSCGLS